MAVLKVLNLENQEAGTVELHDSVAQAALNPFVIKDVVVAHQAALRQGTHKTKERSEVSGSRRKLYRQKGTGNARVGSAQSPTRRHGGTVFGPVPRDHSISLNKKVRKQALASVLSTKLNDGQLIVVENLKMGSQKTKDCVKVLEGLKINKALVVYSEIEPNFELASRNLQNIKSVHCTGLNVYDALNAESLVITKDALQEIEGRLLK